MGRRATVHAHEEVPQTRYTHLVRDEHELRAWYMTFKQYDRDGGGDVDLSEVRRPFFAGSLGIL